MLSLPLHTSTKPLCLCIDQKKKRKTNRRRCSIAWVCIWRPLQRRLWIKQFAQIFKAAVELKFLKVETAIEKKWIMESFFFSCPHICKNTTQFRNIFCTFITFSHRTGSLIFFLLLWLGMNVLFHNLLFSYHLFFFTLPNCRLLLFSFLYFIQWKN